MGAVPALIGGLRPRARGRPHRATNYKYLNGRAAELRRTPLHSQYGKMRVLLIVNSASNGDPEVPSGSLGGRGDPSDNLPTGHQPCSRRKVRGARKVRNPHKPE